MMGLIAEKGSTYGGENSCLLCAKKREIMKILYLTLGKEAFEVMITGEKATEFRKPSRWIESRLFDKNGKPKEYDNVKFTNGYGHDKPCFLAGYYGFVKSEINQTIKYSNGLIVKVNRGDYMILLMGVSFKSNYSIIIN